MTHTKKEAKYQKQLLDKTNKRLERNQNSTFETAFKHVVMQELLRLQSEIDVLKARLDQKNE